MQVWEDMIALNSRAEEEFEVLKRASEYREGDTHTDWTKEKLHIDIDLAAERDDGALPVTKDREGYFGAHHYSYWASGLRDASNLMFAAERLGVQPKTYLDLGCASGRVIRHFAYQYPEVETYGCDINRSHVAWCQQHLPDSLMMFQNHSVPSIPLPDESIDMVSAFSVFTHIEAFETAWLMELRRILKPGGFAWVTVHSDETWLDMKPGWPLYKALQNHEGFRKLDQTKRMPKDRLVFRWRGERSYSSNVFYSFAYMKRNWARYLDIAETHRRLPGFQDVLVMRKR